MNSSRQRSVHREKYDTAKDAARKWNTMYQESQKTIEELKSELTKLKKELPSKLVVNSFKDLEVEKLQAEALAEQLEEDNKDLRHENRNMRKKFREEENKYKDDIAKLERERLLVEGRNQQLQESCKDLRERYNDLKQDYREQQRWSRNRNEDVK